MKHKFNLNKKGFSLVEIVVVIAIVVVLLAVFAPTVLTYTEKSRIQKDESAMDEICNVAQLALADSETFDEVFSYSISNNYVTYSDSSGEYGKMVEDEEYWAPDGSGHAVTITWNPDENGNYTLGEGLVNDMTFGNGSVGQSRTVDEVKQCYLKEMGSQKLHTAIQQSIGAKFAEKSATYKNSSYTMFIRFNLVDGIYRADVYGQFNGTNLLPDSDAAIGSGTETYTPEGEAVVTKPQGGTQQAQYSSSDLQGSGGGNPPTYKQFLPCGHLYGTAGDHTQQGCGHYACEECECVPASCGIEGHYEGDNRGIHGISVTTNSCNSGHTYTCECSGWVVPAEGVYTTRTAINGKTEYLAGEQLPCGYKTQSWDFFTFNKDYNYRYDGTHQRWQILCLEKGKAIYTEEIITEINNEIVGSMYRTFADNTNLTTAPILPEGLVDLDATFDGCTNLKTYIGSTDPDGDFTNYVIPEGVTSVSNMFDTCSQLVKAPKFPSTISSMSYTFTSCYKLEVGPDLTKCPNLYSMGHAFQGTKLMTYHGNPNPVGDMSALVLPANVQQLSYAFMGCDFTISPDISKTKATGLSFTFNSCSAMEVVSRLPSTVTSLYATFESCPNLKSYIGSVDADGDFSNYIIPDGVTDMTAAYQSCKLLTKTPVVPAGVKKLEKVFGSCHGLKGGVITINAQNCTSYQNALQFVDLTRTTIQGSAPKSLRQSISYTGKNGNYAIFPD